MKKYLRLTQPLQLYVYYLLLVYLYYINLRHNYPTFKSQRYFSLGSNIAPA